MPTPEGNALQRESNVRNTLSRRKIPQNEQRCRPTKTEARGGWREVGREFWLTDRYVVHQPSTRHDREGELIQGPFCDVYKRVSLGRVDGVAVGKLEDDGAHLAVSRYIWECLAFQIPCKGRKEKKGGGGGRLLPLLPFPGSLVKLTF